MDSTSCYQKTDSTFYVKKTGKKLVSQNFEPLKSNIMLENSIFSSPFLLFTFWEFLFFVYVHPMSVANRREKTQVGPHVLDACWFTSFTLLLLPEAVLKDGEFLPKLPFLKWPLKAFERF